MSENVFGKLTYGSIIIGAAGDSEGCYSPGPPLVTEVGIESLTVKAPANIPSGFRLDLYIRESSVNIADLVKTNALSDQIIIIGGLESGVTYRLFWRIIDKAGVLVCPDSNDRESTTTFSCSKVSKPFIPFNTIKRGSLKINVPLSLSPQIKSLRLEMRELVNETPTSQWVVIDSNVIGKNEITVESLSAGQQYQFRWVSDCD